MIVCRSFQNDSTLTTRPRTTVSEAATIPFVLIATKLDAPAGNAIPTATRAVRMILSDRCIGTSFPVTLRKGYHLRVSGIASRLNADCVDLLCQDRNEQLPPTVPPPSVRHRGRGRRRRQLALGDAVRHHQPLGAVEGAVGVLHPVVAVRGVPRDAEDRGVVEDVEVAAAGELAEVGPEGVLRRGEALAGPRRGGTLEEAGGAFSPPPDDGVP